jgi:hypothetical protein
VLRLVPEQPLERREVKWEGEMITDQRKQFEFVLWKQKLI